MENLRDAFNSYKVETVSAEGLIIDINGIECYGLWGSVKKISLQDKIIYKGIGKSIFVDKNHDLSYYVNGSDRFNSNDYNQNPGTYGYEWGGYEEETGIQNTRIGAGLSNTNSLIHMNLKPFSRGWDTIWKKIEIFREIHSDRWFLPSRDELNLIYKAKNDIDNLSTVTNECYWSSSEYSSAALWGQAFFTSCQCPYSKYFHFIRSRLCVQY